MTLTKINAILQLKNGSEASLKDALKSAYSRELSDLLFSYPYIKVKVLEEYGIAKRQTASEYLKKIVTAGLLTPLKIGTENYYINHQLMQILAK